MVGHGTDTIDLKVYEGNGQIYLFFHWKISTVDRKYDVFILRTKD